MRSIMQQKDGCCYLCMKRDQDYSTKYVEEHHCLNGTANRRLSTRYGLMIYVCPEHHTQGKNAIHNDAATMLMVKQDAQRAFEANFPNLNFRDIFGKNYL